MAIFNSYVSLPEGKFLTLRHVFPDRTWPCARGSLRPRWSSNTAARPWWRARSAPCATWRRWLPWGWSRWPGPNGDPTGSGWGNGRSPRWQQNKLLYKSMLYGNTHVLRFFLYVMILSIFFYTWFSKIFRIHKYTIVYIHVVGSDGFHRTGIKNH